MMIDHALEGKMAPNVGKISSKLVETKIKTNFHKANSEAKVETNMPKSSNNWRAPGSK